MLYDEEGVTLSSMKSNSTGSSALERRIRREVWHRGFRYRVAYRVPQNRRRSIDFAFPGRKIAVFIDGCFWHGCPLHGAAPKSNAEFWSAKLGRNRERDLETSLMLHQAGWRVLRYWEHEDEGEVVAGVLAALTASTGWTNEIGPSFSGEGTSDVFVAC